MLSFKVVLVGDTSVGKSSLVGRIVHNRFIPHIGSTIGANFATHSMEVDGQHIKLNIWDTAGQERYRSVVHLYYRQVDFCLIVFDIRRYNVVDVKYWIKDFLNKANNPDAKFVLIGNKADLVIDIECGDSVYRDFKEIMDEYDVKLFKISALNGSNVEDLLEYLGQTLISMPSEYRSEYSSILNIPEKDGDPWLCMGCI